MTVFRALVLVLLGFIGFCGLLWALAGVWLVLHGGNAARP